MDPTRLFSTQNSKDDVAQVGSPRTSWWTATKVPEHASEGMEHSGTGNASAVCHLTVTSIEILIPGAVTNMVEPSNEHEPYLIDKESKIYSKGVFAAFHGRIPV